MPQSSQTKNNLQFSEERTRRLWKKDAAKKQCSRKDCPKPKQCFEHRKKKQREGKGLYISFWCPKPRKNNGDPANKGAEWKNKKGDNKDSQSSASADGVLYTSTTYNLEDNRKKLAIFTGKRKTVTMVPLTGTNGFRQATPAEVRDNCLATVTAEVRGMETGDDGSMMYLFGASVGSSQPIGSNIISSLTVGKAASNSISYLNVESIPTREHYVSLSLIHI